MTSHPRKWTDGVGELGRRNVKGQVSHTAHLVLARVLALGAADAKHRRRLGADRVNALKAEVAAVTLGGHVFVADDDDGAGAGPAGKGVSDGHGEARRARVVAQRGRRDCVVRPRGCDNGVEVGSIEWVQSGCPSRVVVV